LLIPPHRQVVPELLQAEAIGFIATEDRLDDVGRKAGQAKHSGFVFDFAVTSRPT